MKLLIVTQVVDTNHPILGFFHRWIIEFATQCEQVHVIALFVGVHDLPANVTVHSLGKEDEESRLTYLWRFYKYSWQLCREYDNVFVHMNQVYVILAAALWRMSGKKVGLWYAHGTVSRSLRIAVRLANMLFTSTKEGMQIDTPKRVIVGQGIDTTLFTSQQRNQSASKILQLVTVGRLAQSKNIETLLHACAELKKTTPDFHFQIIGAATTQSESAYEQTIRNLVSELQLESHITWVGGITQSELPTYLQQADIFIHDGATNSLDKTLLEAVLCGCIVISSNPAYKELTKELAPEFIFPVNDHKQLVRIIAAASDPKVKVNSLMLLLRESHTITNLINNILTKY